MPGARFLQSQRNYHFVAACDGPWPPKSGDRIDVVSCHAGGPEYVYRHSGSSTASVRLFRESHSVVLEITDQGQGMQPLAVGSTPDFTVGISGMRERVHDVDGIFSIESVAREGCTVRVALPLTTRS
jgi:nitrate/nitrite-specific signal transduction histidine kinase